jgi:ornithine carbamoyltransferase
MQKIDYSGNPLAGRDLLRLLDLTPDEFSLVLKTAQDQKAAWKLGFRDAPYAGCAVAIILEKPSMRTRTSFEVGVAQLGAHPVVMSDGHSAFSRGETIQDTTLVLERFVDAIVIRTFAQEKVEEVAEWAHIPVINALTDSFHPCQVLADMLTISEHKGKLAGLKLAYVGDGNNMANSYLEGGVLAGMHVSIATPIDYKCDETILDDIQELASSTGADIELGHDPEAAVAAADVIITDTWVSMGDEGEHSLRVAAFAGFQVNDALMALAKDDAIFLHCLPAHRGEEVCDSVMDGIQSVIYDEAENRLHAQKALLSLLMAKPSFEEER